MANLLITAACNRKCPFCFARSRLFPSAREEAGLYMSLENFRSCLAFLERSLEKSLRLLGGEPTLHPEFVGFVEEALARDFRIHVFTNGIMPPSTAEFLGRIPKGRLTVLCNVSPQARETGRQKELRENALERLGEKARLGVTLTSPELEVDAILPLYKRFGLAKGLRLGIAQPIVGRENEFLSPAYYRLAGGGIMKIVKAAIQEDILVGFDCGMTLCMFTEAELGTLTTSTEGFKSLCSPIIDVGLNLEIWHCFPLSEVLVTRLDMFKTRAEIVEKYTALMSPYHSLGCMNQCLRCDYLRRGQCSGGCLAHTLSALQPRPPRFAPGGTGRLPAGAERCGSGLAPSDDCLSHEIA